MLEAIFVLGTNSLPVGLNAIVNGFIVAGLGAGFSFTGLNGFEAMLGAVD